jgi:isoleucyl-tRNA synthetase
VKEYPNADEVESKWDAFMSLRDDVLKALEVARNEKIIGKSLTASISLYPNQEAKMLLESVEENLKQLFIVSGFEIAGDYDTAPENAQVFDSVKIVITQANGETCERCWIVTPEVGQVADHPTLCHRCADIVKNHYIAE